MNSEVVEILREKYWNKRRRFLLKVAVFYFALGFAVGAVLFLG